MKKIILSLIIMMIAVFANAAAVNHTPAYNIINTSSTIKILDVNQDQKEELLIYMNIFNKMLKNVDECKDDNTRKVLFNNAIKEHTRMIHSTLNNKQYHQYLQILNAAVNNYRLRHNV